MAILAGGHFGIEDYFAIGDDADMGGEGSGDGKIERSGSGWGWIALLRDGGLRAGGGLRGDCRRGFGVAIGGVTAPAVSAGDYEQRDDGEGTDR
jgi:hypothetical protein